MFLSKPVFSTAYFYCRFCLHDYVSNMTCNVGQAGTIMTCSLCQ